MSISNIAVLDQCEAPPDFKRGGSSLNSFRLGNPARNYHILTELGVIRLKIDGAGWMYVRTSKLVHVLYVD